MNAIAQFFQTVDNGFNIVGYIPIVSTITGGIRAGLWATAQMTIGLLGLPIALIMGLFSILFGMFHAWAEALRLFFALIVNSILNMIRGTIEAVPILGNLTTFLYDRIRGGREIFHY